MKIGIITQPLRYNYGGILQAYALQTVLERMGNEVYVVRQSNIRDEHVPFIQWAKRVAHKMLGHQVTIYEEKAHNKRFKVLTGNTWRFVERYIHSYLVARHETAPEGEFDCLVVGSDQVWRPAYNRDVRNMFFSYAENWDVKRIAYAASFGVDNWEFDDDETAQCARLIQKFDGVSVREKSGCELCASHLNYQDAQWVLDPTMLLDKKDYENIIDNENNPAVIIDYTLDEEEGKTAVLRAIERDFPVPVRRLYTVEYGDCQPLSSVEMWLRNIRDGRFVFTDSFHGTVFSIIFNRDFVVYGNKERGLTRIMSLLKLFGLENRLVASPEDYRAVKLIPIDWGRVNETRVAWKRKSLDFLENALQK